MGELGPDIHSLSISLKYLLNFVLTLWHFKNLQNSLVLIATLFFEVEEHGSLQSWQVSLPQEEHTHRLCDYQPLDWAPSVALRPEASVAPGTFVSQKHLTPLRTLYQL